MRCEVPLRVCVRHLTGSCLFSRSKKCSFLERRFRKMENRAIEVMFEISMFKLAKASLWLTRVFLYRSQIPFTANSGDTRITFSVVVCVSRFWSCACLSHWCSAIIFVGSSILKKWGNDEVDISSIKAPVTHLSKFFYFCKFFTGFSKSSGKRLSEKCFFYLMSNSLFTEEVDNSLWYFCKDFFDVSVTGCDVVLFQGIEKWDTLAWPILRISASYVLLAPSNRYGIDPSTIIFSVPFKTSQIFVVGRKVYVPAGVDLCWSCITARETFLHLCLLSNYLWMKWGAMI